MSHVFASRRRSLRTSVAIALTGVAFLSACSDSPPTAGNSQPLNIQLTISDVSGESVRVDPRTATLESGYGAIISVAILDAAGNPVPGAKPAWTTSDANIATVAPFPDSSFASTVSNNVLRAAVAGRAPGQAMIIASYQGQADTARFTITPARQDTSGPGPVTRPTRFELTARVSGLDMAPQSGQDTTRWVLTNISGAIVRFVQLPPLAGDTLPPVGTPVSTPTLIATATTGSDGRFTLPDMPVARFRLEVQPPASSSWAARTFEYSAPYSSTLKLELQLSKKL
ncbi:MAG: hypothetical protein IBJ03_02870 [Gemmatimonadaceae bacterium]|nr:hypothetical protein [Gemmatimonadaceae bacterium]